VASPLYLEANRVRATAANLIIPYYGAAVADVTFPSAVTLTAPVSVKVANLTLSMGILRQRSFAGGATARLVAGIGWGRTVPAKAYANPAGVALSLVLRDVAREVGESVSLATGRSVGLFYVRGAGPAARVLEQLGGAIWWVDDAGVTQVGPRATTTITSAATVADYVGGEGWMRIATEDVASWRPAATFMANTVPTAITVSATRIHTDNEGTLRLEVLTT
jgi:hypothetical protein